MPRSRQSSTFDCFERLQLVTLMGLGVAAGFGVWFVVMLTLTFAGFYCHALHVASYATLSV